MQDLVEKVMVLWKAVDSTSDGLQTSHLAKRLYEYANLLASQGCLATALTYLAPVTSDDVCFVLSAFCGGHVIRFLPKCQEFCIYVFYNILYFTHLSRMTEASSACNSMARLLAAL